MRDFIGAISEARFIGGGGLPFDPLQLAPFAWYDPSDPATVWQDDAGTIPGVVDQPVGRLDDLSGNGYTLAQTDILKRPFLRSANGLWWVEYDGVNDDLINVSFAFSTELLTVIAGVLDVGSTSVNRRAWNIGNDTGNSLSVMLFSNANTNTSQVGFRLPENAGVIIDPALTDPSVVTYQRATPGIQDAWVNNVAKPTQTANTTASPTSRINVGSNHFNSVSADHWVGKIFGLTFFERVISENERQQMEQWLAQKSGATLAP